MAKRIYIIGGSGSGKASLAREISARSGLPVHDLDLVARVDGGNSPAREPAERDRLVAEIVASPQWIVEGIHLGWTDPLLAAADSIIWLDHVTWTKSSGRIVRRFASGAIAEARRQRGWRRFFRFRDYARHVRELAAAIPKARRYESGAGDRDESRAATEAALAPYVAKVIHCRTEPDVAAAVARVTGTSAAADVQRMPA